MGKKISLFIVHTMFTYYICCRHSLQCRKKKKFTTYGYNDVCGDPFFPSPHQHNRLIISHPYVAYIITHQTNLDLPSYSHIEFFLFYPCKHIFRPLPTADKKKFLFNVIFPGSSVFLFHFFSLHSHTHKERILH